MKLLCSASFDLFSLNMSLLNADPVSIVRDHKVKSQLVEIGVDVRTFNADLLYEPWEVYDENGFAFTNFSAFWEKCMSLPVEPTLLLPPWRLVPSAGRFLPSGRSQFYAYFVCSQHALCCIIASLLARLFSLSSNLF